MSSLITVSGDGESILPEMGELSEFHPDQLSNLVDIQEELDKLVAQEAQDDTDMSMSTVDDVDVVDHEVTIGEDQDNDTEMTELPDIHDMEGRHSEISTLMEENLEIGQTITIEAPPVQVEEKKVVPIKPATAAPTSVHTLKAIRPLPDALKGKRPGSITLGSVKKSVVTKVIFTPNTQGNIAHDSPIIVGEAGGQAFRIIGQNKTIMNSPRTITLAQAREMGLKLSPGKVQQILPNQQKGVVRQSLVMDPTKTYAMVKSSPTKILPLPTTGQLQHIAPSPASGGTAQRIIIRHSSGIKTGTFTNTFLTTTGGTSQGQILQFPAATDNLSNQIHQIQLPGQKVQYVRLVTTTTPAVNNNSGVVMAAAVESKADPPPPPAAPTTPAPTPAPAPVPVALTSRMTDPLTSAPIKMIQLAPSPAIATTATQNTNSFERVLVSPGLSQLAAASRPDTKTTNNIVMVPSEFIKHYKPPVPGPLAPLQPSPPSPTKPPAAPPLLTKAKEMSTPREPFLPPTIAMKTKSSAEPPNGLRPRKPCNCTKSQCLKLYCDCFANGEFCFQCNCNCCFNNLDHEEDRQRAIKACLERNPNAFRPKIGKGYIGDERRHNKGCNCKRSGCLKNYCECYEAKIPCSNNCKCLGCRNLEENKDSSKDRSLADGIKTNQQTSVKSKLSSEIQESASRPHAFITSQGTRQPFNLMTQEVVEATCQCLLAVEGDTKSQVPEHVERLILEEFGRCLVQIIDCAARTTVNNNT